MTAFAELDLVARTEKLEAAVSEIRKIGDAGEQTERRVSKATAAMGVGFAKLAGLIGAAVGTLASGAFLKSAINEAQTFETAMFKVDAIIRATGGAAGRSSDQLREQARALSLATLESTDGVLRAQQTLLTFRNVQGDVFDRAIVAAADMSAALGGDLNSATMQLAKALENPLQGLSALTRSGTVFTQAQKDMVKAMVEAGKTAEAQAFILSELEAQYGGTAMAAAQGLAGAQDTLAQRMQELKLAIADQLGLMDLAISANNALANSALYVTENLPAFIDGLRVVGAVIVGLASTQIPAVVAALAAKTAGMTAASIAAGVLTGAMRALGVAVAVAGGPLGLLLGIVGGAAAAMLLLRDNTATAAPIMDDAKDAIDRLNAVLGTSSEYALPAAQVETLALTNENIKLAKSAYEAADAELAKAKAAAYAAQQHLGAESMSSLPFESLPGNEANRQAIANLESAQAGLRDAQAGLNDRIQDGQLALTGAGEAMSEYQRRAIDLTVTMDDLAASVGGGGGGASGADDGFAGRLTALQEQFMTEREVIDAWYNEAQEILADRRAMEILGEEDHRRALLQVEELYQQQLAAIRNQSFQTGLQNAQTFFGNMADAARAGGDRMTGAVRAFSIAQGLINSYLAFTQVLADPSLIGRPFTRIALAGSTLAAGLAQVANMRSGGGGGGGSVSSSRAATATPEPAQRGRFLRVDVQGDGMFADFLRDNIETITDAVFDESKNGGTTVVVGR